MSYRVDEGAVQALDAALPREPAAPLAGGHIVTAQEVDRWWREAQAAQETAREALAALACEVGWSAIVEALHAHGVLHDDRFDGWYGD